MKLAMFYKLGMSNLFHLHNQLDLIIHNEHNLVVAHRVT